MPEALGMATRALGIGLEELDKPYPMGFLPVANDLQTLTMGYMDVAPNSSPRGSTVPCVTSGAKGPRTTCLGGAATSHVDMRV